MRWFLLLLLAGAAVAQPIYTLLPSDVAPVVVRDTTFVPIRIVAQQFGAAVSWHPATRGITITKPSAPSLRLTVGSRVATAGNATITLAAAPFVADNRTLVPLRFIAEAYGVPIRYETSSRTVQMTQDDRLYFLPLPSTRGGIRIDDPRPGAAVQTPLLVQGLANVFEGALIVEVRDVRGTVLGRTIATAGMGAFYPYSVRVPFTPPSGDSRDGEVVVYAEDARGEGYPPLFRTVVPVRLTPR
jgi:hypothetical protein